MPKGQTPRPSIKTYKGKMEPKLKTHKGKMKPIKKK